MNTVSAARRADDLTARARIRDAALAQFAERGYRGATFKGIADLAGVSVGLVQHHFGTKDALRAECDQAVLDVVEHKLAVTESGHIADPDVVGALYSVGPPVMRYIARMMLDSSPATRTLLAQVTSASARFLSSHWPDRFPDGAVRTRDAAAVLVALSLGPLVLHEHLAQTMGLVPWDDIASPKIGLATLDVYSALGEYVNSPVGTALRDTVDRLAERPKGKGRSR